MNPSFICFWCHARVERLCNYSVDQPDGGEDLPLCDACGSQELPTIPELHKKIEREPMIVEMVLQNMQAEYNPRRQF